MWRPDMQKPVSVERDARFTGHLGKPHGVLLQSHECAIEQGHLALFMKSFDFSV